MTEIITQVPLRLRVPTTGHATYNHIQFKISVTPLVSMFLIFTEKHLITPTLITFTFGIERSYF
jgi:hypothetical protein